MSKEDDEIRAWAEQKDLRPSEVKALVALREHPENLNRLRENWTSSSQTMMDGIRRATGRPARTCAYCGAIHWTDTLVLVERQQHLICTRCRDGYYRQCANCEDWSQQTSRVRVQGVDVRWCRTCSAGLARQCGQCGLLFPIAENHNHNCLCVAPLLEFQIPDDGREPVQNDRRLTVEMPKGQISPEGIESIAFLVAQNITAASMGIAQNSERTAAVRALVVAEEPQWQMKRGNFTKRLSAEFYKQYRIKLPEWLISEIGNVAKAHSDQASTYFLEFTRDLNHPAEYFFHKASCWWTQYSACRCYLKNWGGVALRSFPDERSQTPTGRIFMHPMDELMRPTHRTMDAPAYVLFNAYGVLTGPVTARIMAHMLGRTYKQINFSCPSYYINSSQGWLVADEAVCRNTKAVELPTLDVHNQTDAAQVLAARAEVAVA